MKRTTLAAIAALAAGLCLADAVPAMVSLVTPVQFPSRERDVAGLRLDLVYGQCRNFKGLDLGLANHAVDGFSGLALGGVNAVGGRFYGVQAGLANWIGSGCAQDLDERRSVGIQFGFANVADSFCGLQEGWVNVATDSLAGLQAGYLNVAGEVHGVQCGSYFVLGVNIVSGSASGCQIGLVNYAGRMEEGVQIGILNIITRNGWLPVCPLVNGSR